MKRYRDGIAILALLIFLSACTQRNSNQSNQSGNNSPRAAESTGVIKAVHIAKDNGKGGPGEKSDTFGPADRTIHCVVELATSTPGAKIKYSWWVVESESARNEKIEDFEYTTRPEDRVVHGHLTMPQDWPPGKYRVEVFVNGHLEESVEYSVT